MTTKSDKIAAFKLAYPTLRVGSDETGYTEMDAAEYEATIAQWADNELTAETELVKAKADKEATQAKLAALGLTADDLKTLGIGSN